MNRCPPEERPSQGRLISIFLIGLRNKLLHDHLYARKHATFQECCVDAMDYDDNIEVSGITGINTKPKSHDSGSSGSSAQTQEKFPTKEEIADLVLKNWDKHTNQQNRFQTTFRMGDFIAVENVVDLIEQTSVTPYLNPSRTLRLRNGVSCVNGITLMRPRTAIG